QIMPENLPSWSREALGYVVSRRDFLARPDLQIAIVDFKLNQYWQKSIAASNGNVAVAIQRVAAWWYSGKPEKYTNTTTQYYNGHRYPSIADYSQSVLRRYQAIWDSQNAAQPNEGFPDRGV
ncbi:lytic transglycosylase domain-containing protein, partial [Pseudanabaenaceae cyanobacterium LEGE 13415]|nr:lytic transglycosylase domain-containing protein [Pseudanabaenaceae cyanobacterium LEGE 13415]